MADTPESDRISARSRPIGHYLVALVVLAVVPLSLIAGLLVARQASVQRHSIEQRMLATSRAVSVAVDLALDGHRAALESIAQSELIDSRDWPRLHSLATRVASQRGAAFISLFNPRGDQLLNTARAFGSPLPAPFRLSEPATQDSPPVGDTSSLKRVFQTGKASNSDLFTSLSTGKQLFTVDIPVVRNGAVVYALNIGFDPESISRLLTEYSRLGNIMAIVVDRNGFIVGRLSDDSLYTGHKAPAQLLADLEAHDSGGGSGFSLEGVPLNYSFARSSRSGWTVSTGVQRSSIDSPVQAVWFVSGTLALLGLGFGLLLALMLARRLASSVGSLASAARQGTRPQVTGLRTREVMEVASSLEEALLTHEKQAQEHAARLLAEKQNQSKDEFLAMLGHELRNPLAAVAIASEVLNRGADALSLPARNAIAIVTRQTRVLARLLDDLLEAGRFATGKITIKASAADLSAIVESALAAARAAGRLDDHRLQVESSPVWVHADAGRIEQVVGNLLTNALKYTPRGGRISITVRREEKDAVLSIADEGTGIDAELMPRIFDMFVQGPRSIDRAQGGLGIGLTLVRRIVELHGGTVVARSDGPDRGSRFEVRLPATGDEAK